MQTQKYSPKSEWVLKETDKAKKEFFWSRKQLRIVSFREANDKLRRKLGRPLPKNGS